MKQRQILFVAALALTGFFFASCSSSSPDDVFGEEIGPAIAVRFDANGGTWPASANAADRVKAVGVNGKIKQLPAVNPVLSGHNFLGWYIEKHDPVFGTETVSAEKFSLKTIVRESTTVYALYKAKTIELDSDGVPHAAASVTFVQCSGGDITIEPVEALWSNDYKLADSDIPLCGDREHYTQIESQLNKWWLDIYDATSGELIEEGEQFTANIPVSKTDADGVTADDITVYARWTGNIYTVTFDPQDGTFINKNGEPLGDQNYSVQVQYPESLPSESYPFITKTDGENNIYTLGGWYDLEKDTVQENDVEFNGVVDRNMTVFANWISPEADTGLYKHMATTW